MFYSDDHEPVHVHICNAGREAKYNVQPMMMVYNHGFKKHELSLIESILEENTDVLAYVTRHKSNVLSSNCPILAFIGHY